MFETETDETETDETETDETETDGWTSLENLLQQQENAIARAKADEQHTARKLAPVVGDYLGPNWLQLSQKGNPFGRGKAVDLPTDVMPILAFDPGGTTGWSLLVLPKRWGTSISLSMPQDVILRSKVRWHHGQIDCSINEDSGVHHLIKLIDEWPSAAIVVEDFILRPHRNEMSRELLSPVRITAKIEHHLWKNRRKMWLQTPAQAKTVGSDERLKAWGVYTREGGLQHARDADRHVMLFLRRCMGNKGIATRNVAWPHLFPVDGG